MLISTRMYKPHEDQQQQQFLGLGLGRRRSAILRRCLAAFPPDTLPPNGTGGAASQDAEEYGETARICTKELFSPEEHSAVVTKERGRSPRRSLALLGWHLRSPSSETGMAAAGERWV